MENFFKNFSWSVYEGARSESRARPLKLPQPGPLLNIVGRTSDWFVDSLVLCFVTIKNSSWLTGIRWICWHRTKSAKITNGCIIHRKRLSPFLYTIQPFLYLLSLKQLFAYGKAAKRIFCTYGTVIYETTCQSDVRPTIFKRALEGGCKGEIRTAQLGWFPPCCSFLS